MQLGIGGRLTLATDTLTKSAKQTLVETYKLLFEKQWPTWLAGLLIAVIALFIFLWEGPWGIAGGYRNWGDWTFYLLGLYEKHPPFPPWMNFMSLSNLGLLVGAMISALMSRQFGLRRAPRWEYVKAFAGGVFMGTGAVLAAGCNVGGFYTATGMFDLGGIAMMFGLGAGAFIGLKYLVWEMDHIPQKWTVLAPGKTGNSGSGWHKSQPWAGFVLLLTVMAIFYLYAAMEKTQQGGLLFFGMLIGIVMHRARFCFVRAFRCPFMTGEAETVKAVAISLMVLSAGSAVIKWAYIQDPMTGVYHNFWFGSLIGGLIFGIGMLLAGGCASSTLWRVGEGNAKLMVTLVTFALTNSLVAAGLKKIGVFDRLGKGVFLPDSISWQVTIPLLVVFLGAWIIIAKWNEESEKFVVF